MTGCAQKPAVVHKVVPVEQPQQFEVTIEEGKTTKKQVIDALGMPEAIYDDLLQYKFDAEGKDKKICKLHLIQKDGTVFNVVLGKGKYMGLSCMIGRDDRTGEVDKSGIIQSASLSKY